MERERPGLLPTIVPSPRPAPPAASPAEARGAYPGVGVAGTGQGEVVGSHALPQVEEAPGEGALPAPTPPSSETPPSPSRARSPPRGPPRPRVGGGPPSRELPRLLEARRRTGSELRALASRPRAASVAEMLSTPVVLPEGTARSSAEQARGGKKGLRRPIVTEEAVGLESELPAATPERPSPASGSPSRASGRTGA